MAFLALSIIAVLLFLGIGVQAWQPAQAMPDADMLGRMEATANVSTQQALIFGAACVTTANAAPGLISVGISPALPVGVSTPVGTVCTAAARAGGSRDIYGYMPVALDTAGFLIQNAQGNTTRLRVNRQGAAANMMTDVTYTVPAMVPVGALIGWVQATA